jgi:hypothetical protein
MDLWGKLAKLGGRDRAAQTREAAVGIAANVLVFGHYAEAGARELHLRRRRGNPLFPPDRRMVTVDDLAKARVLDMADAAQLEQETATYLTALRHVLARQERPPDWFQDARRQIDELIDRATALGGRALARRAELENLFGTLIAELRPGIATQAPDALRAFDQANENRAAGYSRPSFAFGQQLPSLPPEEIVPALLCEEPDVIADFLTFLTADAREQVRTAAAGLLRQAAAQGYRLPNRERVLEALGLPSASID